MRGESSTLLQERLSFKEKLYSYFILGIIKENISKRQNHMAERFFYVQFAASY